MEVSSDILKTNRLFDAMCPYNIHVSIQWYSKVLNIPKDSKYTKVMTHLQM